MSTLSFQEFLESKESRLAFLINKMILKNLCGGSKSGVKTEKSTIREAIGAASLEHNEFFLINNV